MSDFYGFGGFEGVFFSVFPVIFILLFALFLAVFVVTLVQNVRHEKRNRAAPVLTVNARVTGKRTAVSHNRHTGADNMVHSTAWTHYFATFEVESGDRMELSLAAEEYGLLAEGDTGRLTFQGTQYKGFVRER